MISRRSKDLNLATRLVHTGSGGHWGLVNAPIYRASTLLFDSVEDYQNAVSENSTQKSYARYGTATTKALELAIADAEGGHDAMVFPSGLAAITVALMSVLAAGSHILISDSVYHPTRRLCLQTLARFGVKTTFFDPCIGEDLTKLFRPETKAIFLESPGSATFEVQDVPLLTKLAHAHNCKVIMDNTWATPVFFNPISFGVDLVIHSATKYLVGHSDAIMGIIVVGDPTLGGAAREVWAEMGQIASPDDCFLALRGMRTLELRMKRHFESTSIITDWLSKQPQVKRIFYPAHKTSQGHNIWKRDFRGASGLFGLQLQNEDPSTSYKFANSLELFGIGASWGGHESLIIPMGNTVRSEASIPPSNLLRIHIGLEEPNDLIQDLTQSFNQLSR